MGNVVLGIRELVPGSPRQVFSRFGRRTDGGWLFDAECDDLVPGGVLRFSMPGPHGSQIRALGRIHKMVPGQRIVVEQESPWRSRIELTFRRHGAGTQVTATVTIGEECLAWLLANDGHDFQSAARRDNAVNIGVMLSLSGPAAVFGRACQNAAELAVEEINLDGGISGRPLRLVVADDGTSPKRARREYRRLIGAQQCRAVVAMVSSASMAAIRPIAAATANLLLHSTVHEGRASTDTVIQLGQDPGSQLCQSVPALMAGSGERSWAFVGNDYNWPRAVHRHARRAVAKAGGVLLAEHFIPLGAKSHEPVIEALASCGAVNIISAMVGTDAARFERSFYEAGLRRQHQTMAMLFDETVREHVGNEAATDIWSVQTYFRELDTVASNQLRTRWSERFGPVSAPLSSTAAMVYDAVHQYARAVRRARSLEPRSVARQLMLRRPDRMSHLVPQGVLAQAAPGGFRLHDLPA